VSEVRLNGALVDSYTTPFGIRTVEFTKDRGMLLNGQHILIKGVCDHHDLGCLGSIALRRGFERQLEILKGMGCNALRTSHNPPSPELLDLCDQMGILVMDECFDEWKMPKVENGYGLYFDQWSEKDLTSMIRRDRNHPSIILWSIGNEIAESYTPDGDKVGKPLVDICHREDPTRLVTAACPDPHDSVRYGFDKILDVFGINYGETSTKSFYLDPVHGQEPMIGSETASSVDSRGDYGLSLDAGGNVAVQNQPDQKTHQMSTYDEWYPPWASNAETEEINLKNAPWVAGEFVWTGFDYLGEPTPYGWPSRSSYFGIVDLCGFPKDRYYMYKSVWGSQPLVHIMPHWSWPGYEGKAITVRVYTNADMVELLLNGKSLGVKHLPADAELVELDTTQHKKIKTMVDGKEVTKQENHFVVTKNNPSLHLAWSVPYASGELKAVASKDGQVVATDRVRTAGPPAKITLTPDRAELIGNGQDLSFLTVSILDKDGNVCPDANNEIHFAVTGDAASLAGVDNGDATNHESFQGTQHLAYHGMALAVLKTRYDASGPVTLTASADGLPSVSANLTVVPPK